MQLMVELAILELELLVDWMAPGLVAGMVSRMQVTPQVLALVEQALWPVVMAVLQVAILPEEVLALVLVQLVLVKLVQVQQVEMKEEPLKQAEEREPVVGLVLVLMAEEQPDHNLKMQLVQPVLLLQESQPVQLVERMVQLLREMEKMLAGQELKEPLFLLVAVVEPKVLRMLAQMHFR